MKCLFDPRQFELTSSYVQTYFKHDVFYVNNWSRLITLNVDIVEGEAISQSIINWLSYD